MTAIPIQKHFDALLQRGVRISSPSTVTIGSEVNIDRISGADVVIHPGCRIFGQGNLVSAGVRLGAEGGMLLTASILAAMCLHLLSFERGREGAALDLVITLGGIAYLGWVAGYLIDLRLLPNGSWWLMLVLIIVWVADAAAYFVGVRFGRHKMLPRLSPKKSWEGFAAGIIAGTAFAGVGSTLFSHFGPLDVGVWHGLWLGLVLSTLTTLGDLGESLFKRSAGVKDSGTFLPGHGGAFDRIDSLIWAGVLGYFWIRYVLV